MSEVSVEEFREDSQLQRDLLVSVVEASQEIQEGYGLPDEVVLAAFLSVARKDRIMTEDDLRSVEEVEEERGSA